MTYLDLYPRGKSQSHTLVTRPYLVHILSQGARACGEDQDEEDETLVHREGGGEPRDANFFHVF